MEDLRPKRVAQTPARFRDVAEVPAEPSRKRVAVVVKTAKLQEGLHTATCVQCGVNPAGAVKRRLEWVSPWVYFGLLANILVLALLYYASRRVVDASLPLCADCAAADRRGRALRSWSVLGVVAAPMIGGLLGAMLTTDAAMFGLAAGLVAGVVGIVAAHVHTRFDVITAQMIDKKAGTTTLLAAPPFGRVLDEEAPDAKP